MRPSILREFGELKPRAIVIDDDQNAGRMTARQMENRGFDVIQLKNMQEFDEVWRPGLYDVIIADWDLSGAPTEHGDHVLENVRKRDWDVPFVLVSGRLDEANNRASVLARLLENGNARFVTRGYDGIRRTCDEAEELIERRDQALLKLVLSMRRAALDDVAVPTTNGQRRVRDVLAETVLKPETSKSYGRPIARALVEKKV